MRFTDPTGREVNLSGMSEEERKRYESQIATQRSESKLFDAMYSSLEGSKNVYVIKYGETTTVNEADGSVRGQFATNGDGGTVTFSNKDSSIDGMVLSEELFHAYQHDNRANYASGEFNVEFEAKLASTMIASDAGQIYPDFQGMSPFQGNVGMGEYGKGLEVITPSNVMSSNFIGDYKSAANAYGKYNKSNNIGNSHYHKSTTVAPYSLQQMVIKAYGK